MNFKKILVFIFISAIGQGLMSAAAGGGAASSFGTGLIRQIGAKAVAQNVIPIAPSLIASKIGTMTGGSNVGSLQVEIPKAKLIQYKDAMQEALQYARSVSQKPIEFQSPLTFQKQSIKFQKPIIVSASPIEAKTFLDLELVKILKNKTISSPNFLQTMIALAAMFGFYKLVDFLNDLYENNTILMWAVEADNENIVGYLLDLGADIHKQNSDGDTAMLIAARFGNTKIVELLINKIKEKYENDPKRRNKK